MADDTAMADEALLEALRPAPAAEPVLPARPPILPLPDTRVPPVIAAVGATCQIAARPAAAPLVSIVTPVRNAAATLAETVASIRGQSFTDWEAFLVDDASDDGSAALIASLAEEDRRLRPLYLPGRLGAAGARNAAIRAARGRFIAFLDADDLWHPTKLALQVALLQTGAGLVHSGYRRIDAAGRVLGEVAARDLVDYTAALRGNPIGCLTAIYDTARFGRVEMPDMPRRQDYALWLQLLRTGILARAVPASLASYRVRPGSLSSNRLAAARATWRVLRESERLPLNRATRSFGFYAMRAISRRL